MRLLQVIIIFDIIVGIRRGKIIIIFDIIIGIIGIKVFVRLSNGLLPHVGRHVIAAVGSTLILTWVIYVLCPDLFAHLCIVNEILICENWRTYGFLFSFMTFCDVDVLSGVLKLLPFGSCQRCELCCMYLNDLFCLCNLISVRKYSLVKVRRLR